MSEFTPRIVYPTRYGLVPWWILAGSSVAGRVLLVGDFNQYEVSALSNICSSLHCFDLGNAMKSKFEIPSGVDDRHDVVILKTLDSDAFSELPARESGLGRVLDRSETILLLESNECHISKFWANPLKIFKSIFFDLRKHDFQERFPDHQARVLETQSYHGQPHEAFPEGSYYTNKNPFLRSERIKHCLLNSPFSRIFFNSRIWILSSARKSYLDILQDDIARNARLSWRGPNIRLLKVIFCGMKIIVSYTSRGDREPENIVVVPLFEKQLQQRINEQSIVARLHETSVVAPMLVEEIVDGTSDSIRYFAMREYNGVTVDYPHARLGQMTAMAVAAINRFAHCLSTENSQQGSQSATNLGSKYFPALLSRYPFHARSIRRLERSLGEAAAIPLIDFMHGDMKIENFVFNASMSSIIGIIDLELARVPGLPLLDLFYLISYNYKIRREESFYQSLLRLATNDLESIEIEFIDFYCKHLNLDIQQKNVCLALFFLHHYAERFMFAEEDTTISTEFRLGCKLVSQLLDQSDMAMFVNLGCRQAID